MINQEMLNEKVNNLYENLYASETKYKKYLSQMGGSPNKIDRDLLYQALKKITDINEVSTQTQVQKIKVAIHEITHVDLKNMDSLKRQKELQADSVEYAICKHFNLKSNIDFSKVTEWNTEKGIHELKENLDIINNKATELIEKIENQIKEISLETTCHDDEIDLDKEPANKNISKDLEDANAPIVIINWSESNHPKLSEGTRLSLGEADKLIAELDQQQYDERQKEGYEGFRYLKTSFKIEYVLDGEKHVYAGRVDLGDNDNGLINHIRDFAKTHINDNFYIDDKPYFDHIQNNLIPYLEKHIELEQTLKNTIDLKEGLKEYNLDAEQKKKLCDSMMDYVLKAQKALNNGTPLPARPVVEDIASDMGEHINPETEVINDHEFKQLGDMDNKKLLNEVNNLQQQVTDLTDLIRELTEQIQKNNELSIQPLHYSSNLLENTKKYLNTLTEQISQSESIINLKSSIHDNLSIILKNIKQVAQAIQNMPSNISGRIEELRSSINDKVMLIANTIQSAHNLTINLTQEIKTEITSYQKDMKTLFNSQHEKKSFKERLNDKKKEANLLNSSQNMTKDFVKGER